MNLENKTKKELLSVIENLQKEAEAIHGLLDDYGITRQSLSCAICCNDRTELVLYGRVLMAIHLLHKTGHIESKTNKRILDEWRNQLSKTNDASKAENEADKTIATTEKPASS